MARVKLIEPGEQPELAGLVAKFSGARRGKVLNLYKLLLASPQVADGWFGHMNGVRWGTSLSGRVRELIIIRVAWLLDAAYAKRQHIPKLAAADGVEEATCHALAEWRGSPLFSAAEQALLAFVDAVTAGGKVPDDVFAALKSHFDERAIVEITVVAATYNMHVRVTNALELDLEVDP